MWLHAHAGIRVKPCQTAGILSYHLVEWGPGHWVWWWGHCRWTDYRIHETLGTLKKTRHFYRDDVKYHQVLLYGEMMTLCCYLTRSNLCFLWCFWKFNKAKGRYHLRRYTRSMDWVFAGYHQLYVFQFLVHMSKIKYCTENTRWNAGHNSFQES